MLEKNQLLTRKEAAKFLGVKESTLSVWASTKRYNLPIIKVGRLAKYRASDLIKFLDDRTQSQTETIK